MIYLYSLPNMSFNMPNIAVPLVKGYLSSSGIKSKQFDLTISFLEKCITANYFKKHFKYSYCSLSKTEKKIVDNIDIYVKQMKSSNINTDVIISANENLEKYLNILSGCYSFSWKRRDLYFDKKITIVDDLLEFAMAESNKIFDDILDINYEVNNNDVFYISIQYPYQLPYAIRLASKIKFKNSIAKIIIGGDYITHINKNAKEIIQKYKYIDAINFYANYESLVKIIKFYKNNNKATANINNTYIKFKDNIVYNYINIKEKLDVDKYIPDFEGLELKKYLSNIRMIPLTLNHGCYHSKCKFCSRYYYNGYCKYNVSKLFEFIKEMYDKHSIQAIYFVDECVPPEILINLANYLLKNNINISWMVETRIEKDYLDKSIPELLYKSGCREISFGIESFNQKVLDDMNKKTNLRSIKKVLKNFYKSGIVVSATFMIGYPTESLFNIYKTLFFIKHFKFIDTFGLGVFNYMRNSILVNNSGIDEENDLNLIYRTNNDNNDEYMNIIHQFNQIKKIKRFSEIRKKILYRSEYMYLDREKFSLNYKDGRI